MDGLDMTRVRTSMNRTPSGETPEQRDTRQLVFHQELLDNHKAVVVRFDQDPGCWADRMLWSRGRIIVIRLDKLLFIPRWISMWLEALAKDGFKRRNEDEEARA